MSRMLSLFSFNVLLLTGHPETLISSPSNALSDDWVLNKLDFFPTHYIVYLYSMSTLDTPILFTEGGAGAGRGDEMWHEWESFSIWTMEIFQKFVVMTVQQLCKYTKNHETAHIKWENCMACWLYLHKTFWKWTDTGRHALPEVNCSREGSWEESRI